MLAEAKLHCRVDHSDEDAKFEDMIRAARNDAQVQTRHALISQTVQHTFDSFPCGRDPICLQLPPMISLTSIVYVAGDGTSTTYADTPIVIKDNQVVRLYPPYGEVWPTARDQENAVVVTSVHGFGTTASDVPPGIKAGMLLVIEHLYRNRGAEGPSEFKDAAQRLFIQERVMSYP